MLKVPPYVRDLHDAYSRPGQTLASVAERNGRTKQSLSALFSRWRLQVRRGGHGTSREPVTRPPQYRAFCGQCERRVCSAEAARCASRWCKAKPAEVMA